MNIGRVSDLLATGDPGRVDEAFERFLSQLASELDISDR
jgi:hypothetical protein